MPAKTIYVQEPDVPLWEWLRLAAEQEHRSVSFMLARAIEALQQARRDDPR